MDPIYTQPGTILKEDRNPTLVSYAMDSKVATKYGPKIENVATLPQSERNYIIFYNSLNNKSYPKLPLKEKTPTTHKLNKITTRYQMK